jgi:acyl phosphate:glycerol-3-phosphate acyltransferase
MPWMEQLRSARWGQGSCIASGAYLLGCVATGYYLVRWRLRQDVRELGSGNIGARNVGRVLGKQGFFLTLAGDAAKGALAVGAVQYFTKDDGLTALALLAVVMGHLWPMQLGFRGGKGVAPSLGALALYDLRLAFAFVGLFAGAALLARKTVLPGLFAFICLPLVSFYMGQPPAKVVATSLLAGLILMAHRRNIADEVSPWIEHRHIDPEHEQSEL